MSVDVVHEDDHLLVAMKPAGLPAVPGRMAHLKDCLASRVQAVRPDALVVHRLDMATSGVMLFARGKPMQRLLSQLFAQRQVHKHYVAIVRGCVADDAGEIDAPLRADWPNRPRQLVDSQNGKPSLTRYRVLQRDLRAHTTRLLLEPVTGRSHQLRVHLRHLGHPIVGDALYGGTDEPPTDFRQRLMLHAQSLSLPHPNSGRQLQVERAAPF